MKSYRIEVYSLVFKSFRDFSLRLHVQKRPEQPLAFADYCFLRTKGSSVKVVILPIRVARLGQDLAGSIIHGITVLISFSQDFKEYQQNVSLPRKLNNFLSRTRDDTGGVSSRPTMMSCLCSTLPILFVDAISTEELRL